mmetsp:Transcript_16189/g.22120  ORF Transcript_16189/g.22120 Transcript_16189/m.22120 type:complete len:443 (-) Transcript_16189:188-1516(-)
MMSIVAAWDQATTDLKSKNSWYCSGKNSYLPLMNCFDESLQFPVSNNDCENLIKRSQAAPFGRKTETLVDLEVRKAWQIDADKIQFQPSWDSVLQGISHELEKAYGVKNRLVFYKMLVYNEGCHFKIHKDTLRDKSHISSLLVSLPTTSGFEGGVLQVHSPDRSITMNWDGQCDGNTASWCSFYTDCDHELLPMTSGYRLILAYQVYQEEVVESPTSSNSFLQYQWYFKERYLNKKKADVINTAPKDIVNIVQHALAVRPTVYILLTHKYGMLTSPAHLKGTDRVMFEILKQFYADQATVTSCEVLEYVDYTKQDGDRFMTFKTFKDDKEIFNMRSLEKVKQLTLKRKDPFNYNASGELEENDEENEVESSWDYEDIMYPTLYFRHPDAVFLFGIENLHGMGNYRCRDIGENTGNEASESELEYRVSLLRIESSYVKEKIEI